MSIPEILTGWKLGGIALAILAGGAGASAAMTNHKLDQHRAQADSMIVELRAIRDLQETQLCIQVAQLRGTDWTVCVIN